MSKRVFGYMIAVSEEEAEKGNFVADVETVEEANEIAKWIGENAVVVDYELDDVR